MLVGLAATAPPAAAAGFGAGDLVVVRIGDGSAALSSAAFPVFLDEYTPSGTFVQSVALPTIASGSDARLTASGSSTTDGGLTLSPNSQYLALGGYDAAVGTPSVVSTTSATVNRVAAVVDSAGVVDTSTKLTAYSGSNIRGAVTSDGTNIWTGGSGTSTDGGVRYATKGMFGSSGTGVETSASNVRLPSIVDGQLYVSSGSGAFVGVNTVGSGTPTGAGNTMTNIASIPGGCFGYALLDRDPGVAGPDTLYAADQAQGINKFSFNGSTWTAKGGVSGNFTGITGSVVGSNAVLYATSGSGAGNGIVSLTDTAAFNASMSAAPAPLVPGTPNTVLRGLAFAPTPAPVSPAITTQPASQTINSGDSATMSVVATGTAPLSYQWYVGQSGDTSSPISGATSSSYTTPPLSTATSYWVRVTNAAGSVNSNTATITVGAANTLNGCKASTTPGAEMGHYPAWPGSQSYLRVACIFQHATGGGGDFVSSTYTIHDFSNVIYHNGAARTITNTAAIAAGATSFTATACTSMAGYVNRGISSATAGLAARTFIKNLAGCTINLNKATTAAIPAGTTFLVDNSAVRSVTDATLSPVSPMITSATSNFTAADTGLSVTGTNIPDGSTLTFLTATTADISSPPTAGAAQTVTIGGTLEVTTTRTVNDGAFPATNQITSTAARFQTSDVGLRVLGAGITQPCFIQTRNSATLVTLSSACSDGSVGTKTVTVGEPSFTAPTATDTVLNQGVQLPLDPSLVPGSPRCSADKPSGFGIEGTWLNPGAFQGGTFATQPAGTKAIGEILFNTSVITFGAYIIEVPTAIDPLIGAPHYNIVFPNVPTTLALCPSTATSPGLGFSIGINATTASQAAIPTGVGRPGTAQLRSTRASTTGSTSTVYITDDISGAGLKWTGTEFNRVCIIPSGPPDINFPCGDG
jgi:hypothetical protein